MKMTVDPKTVTIAMMIIPAISILFLTEIYTTASWTEFAKSIGYLIIYSILKNIFDTEAVLY